MCADFLYLNEILVRRQRRTYRHTYVSLAQFLQKVTRELLLTFVDKLTLQHDFLLLCASPSLVSNNYN